MATTPDIQIQAPNKDWSEDPTIAALSTKLSVIVGLVNELIIELHRVDGQVRALRRKPQRSDVIEFDVIG
jgi:hypothetical protein